MKKKTLSFLFCGALLSIAAKTDKSSQSFLYTRPAHQNIALNQACWYGPLFDKEKPYALQANMYYQKSYKADEIKKYFLLNDRAQVKINRTATDRDVLPEWLGLPTNFSGLLTMAPEQEQFGGMFEVRRNLPALFGWDFFKDWYVHIMLPVTRVKNNLNLTQNSIENAGASTLDVYDILTAFNNPDWNYSKIDGKRTETHIAECRLTIGTTIFSTERSHASTYSALSIPTKKKLPGTYLFDSQVGFNGHVGYIWGLNLQAPLSRESDLYQLTWNINLENNFLIRNHQYRTFDLKDKEWSRFLNLRKKDQTSNTLTPGVNILTQYVRVSPHAIVDFSTSFRLNYNGFEADLGYGLWAHGGDSIKFNNTWREEYGIAGTTTNTSASSSTIKTRAADDTTFTVIKESDLDKTSASMLPIAVHKIHASLGYKHYGQSMDNDLSIGGFGEFPRNPTKALATWGIWVKAGGAF